MSSVGQGLSPQDRVVRSPSRIRGLFHRRSPSNSNSTNTLVPSPQTNDSLAVQLYTQGNAEAHHTNQQVSVSQIAQPQRSTSPKAKRAPRGRHNQYGLHELGDHTPQESDAKQFPVDIIAVHGMNGDAFNTWTSETEEEGAVNWLEDFLPVEFPGARIFTFGYPAKVVFSRGTATIRTHAQQLLNDLQSARQDENAQRPIIFICHSMGGIVVKKALILCVSDSPAFDSIYNSVKAIFFLATPHHGSAAAETAATFAKFGNFISIGAGIFDTSSLKSLKRDSRELYEISTDFRNQTEKYEIFSFHEQLKMPWPLSKLIVTPDNGSLGIKKETPIPMPGYDHRSIARFASTKDNGYKLVLGPLKRVMRNILQAYISNIKDEDEPCLQSLSFPTQTTRYGDIKQKSHGHTLTSKWILSHPHYKTWISSPSGILWIKGHPGTGKSTLMASISSQTQTQSLSFFFDSNGTFLQKTQMGMYRSLLYQIYRRSLSARTIILSAYQEKVKSLGSSGEWDWHLTELQELLFAAIVQSAKQMEIVILVDALDEVLEEGDMYGKVVGDLIIGFFHRFDDLGVDKRVKICFSSRHFPNVRVTRALEITVEEHNEEAIKLFVSTELSEHVDGWEKEHQEEREKLVQLLVQRANRQFLWAGIRVPMVTRCLNNGTHSLGTVYRVLEGESDKLSDLYQGILLMSMVRAGREKCLQLFQWVTLANGPLSLGDLRYALACGEDVGKMGLESCGEVEGFVESDERMEKLVKSLSGGLAMVSRYVDGGKKNNSVRFIHKTVHDYVRGFGLSFLFQRPENHITTTLGDIIGVCEFELATSCLHYLASQQVLKAIESWEIGDEKSIPFIQYASTKWPYHANRSESHGHPQTSVIELLGPDSPRSAQNFKSWLSVISHLQFVQHYYRFSAYGGSHLIHIASSWNLKSAVRLLLDAGAHVDVADYQGRTSLARAAKFGHKDLVVMLLDAGASSQTLGPRGITPVGRAAAESHPRIVDILLETNSDLKDALNSAFHGAAQAGDCALLEMLIEKGADVNQPGPEGGTALQVAISEGHEAAARLLVSRGADINSPIGSRIGSALQEASNRAGRHGDERGVQFVRFLLDEGADVNFQGGNYQNALQAAVSNILMPSFSIVRLLLDHGADVNDRGGEMGTSLQAAAAGGQLEVVRMLLNAGAIVNVEGGKYGSALHAALHQVSIYEDSEQIVQLLLENGADIHTHTSPWGSAIHSAAYGGSVSIVKLLLNKGVDVSLPGGTHGNPMHAAVCGSGGVPIVKLLVENGADINAPGEMYGSPLEAAIVERHVPIVRFLIGCGADVKTGKPTGSGHWTYDANYPSLLQIAARLAWRREKPESVEILLDAGMDINAPGLWSGNVLSAAVYSGNVSLVQMLLDRGVHVDMTVLDRCLRVWVSHNQRTMKKFVLELRKTLAAREQ